MKKPTIAEIQAYIIEKNYNLSAEAFFYHYEQKDWLVGKAPMKKWRSAVSNWGVHGWGKTAKSDRASRKRNERPDDHQKHRDDYEDYFKGKTRAALEDLRKDPGKLKHVTWLMDEILGMRDNGDQL